MTVGITTFHFDTNFGAVLQSTALVQCLRAMGVDARIINFPRKPERALASWTSVRSIAKNLLMLPNYGALRRRLERTLEFIARYQTLTPTRFRSIEELLSAWPPMDAYITGSDQVWNVERWFDPVFFLSPADPARARLIAYAASFGTATIPDEMRDRVALALRRFHAISCREQSGREIVEQLTGVRHRVVCDPVFLHRQDHYQSMESPYPVPESYILVYAIGVDDSIQSVVKTARERLGVPVFQFVAGTGRSCVRSLDRGICDAGPAEFLHLMRNASFVCTNSFHGTAFALLMRKPFLATPALHGRNTRIDHLLGTFSEESRCVDARSGISDEVWSAALTCNCTKWSQVHESLRSDGRGFLMTALGVGSEERRVEKEGPA